MASGNSGEDDGNIFIRPQCLIDTNEEGHFVVEPSVLDQLRGLDGDVIVVAVVGPYRTGKSYLMNRLCGHCTGRFSLLVLTGHFNFRMCVKL